MIKHIFFITLLFGVCLGCNNTSQVFSLHPGIKTVELPVTPMAFAPFNMHIGTYAGKDGAFAYFLSTTDSAVHLYSLGSKTTSDIISLGGWLKSRKAIQSLVTTGIWMENAKTIWIDFPQQDTLFRLDVPSGKVNDFLVINMPDRFNGNPIDRMRLLPINPINRAGGVVYLAVNCYFDDASKSSETPTGAPFFAAFKQKDKTLYFTSFVGTFPEAYYQKNMYLNESYGVAIGSDSILINHFFSNSVSLVTPAANKPLRFCFKSSKSKIFKGLTGSPKDQNAIMKLFVSDQCYNRLMYDPYRNLIYRIYINQAPESKNGKIEIPEKWSFVICDKSLKTCGETELSMAEYYPGTILISPDGIFIRKINSISDSTISLQLFNLQTIQVK